MCTMTRIRGALPLARWRKEIIRSIGLCGSYGLACLTHKRFDFGQHCHSVYPDVIKVCGSRIHLHF